MQWSTVEGMLVYGERALNGGNLMYWYDADAQNAALPEPEKPKGPTDADVRRLADEIKSLKRPPNHDRGTYFGVKGVWENSW